MVEESSTLWSIMRGSNAGLGFEQPPDGNAAIGQIWHPIAMTDRLLPRGLLSSGANLVPDGARKSRHFRRPGTSTTRSIRRYASPSSPTPRCCGRRPTSAMRSTRRGAPDPAQHDQINFYGTCSFDVETELRREGHRPLHPPAASPISRRSKGPDSLRC